jgi:hypothetical protein
LPTGGSFIAGCDGLSQSACLGSTSLITLILPLSFFAQRTPSFG